MKSSVEQFKSDLYKCRRTRCGYCREGCPVFQEITYESVFAMGRNTTALAILTGVLKPSEAVVDRVLTCTLCRNCEEWCDLPLAKINKSLRAYLVERGFYDSNLFDVVSSIMKYSNPYLRPPAKRGDWIHTAFKANSKTLLYAGCTYSYFFPWSLKSLTTLLFKAKVQINYLSSRENCCGNLLLETGFRKEFEEVGRKNAELFSKLGINDIVTLCPACYEAFKKEYPEYFDFDFNVYHITEYIDRLISEDKIHINEDTIHINERYPKLVTYHDPCILARGLKIVNAPREIIKKIPGVELIEMPNTKFETRCCGAGGGMLASHPKIAIKIAERRIHEAEGTGADTLVTICPACELLFGKTIRRMKSKLKLIDLIDLLNLSVR
jgi:Fe-S oxidoreductase